MRKRLSILLLSVVSLVSARAQLTVTSHYEDIAERGPVLHYKVQNGDDFFFITPPVKWQAEAFLAENTLTFRNEQLGAFLMIKFRNEAAPKTAKDLERTVLEKHPGARSVEKFACIARDSEGLAMIIEFQAADGSPYASQIGVIPYGTSSVEISLTGPVGALSNAHGAWTTILNSLQRKLE